MASAKTVADEEWRDIPPLPFYQASSTGQIRSLDRSLEVSCRHGGMMKRLHRGRLLKPKTKPNGCGQFYRCFYVDGGAYWQVNRAVCWAFRGSPPSDRHEAAHLDGQSQNDFASNLVWATPSENAEHKLSHGTSPAGERNGSAILTDNVVREIIKIYAGGEIAPTVAVMFGVSASTVSMVVRGDIWPHVVSAYRPAAIQRAKENILRGLSWNR